MCSLLNLPRRSFHRCNAFVERFPSQIVNVIVHGALHRLEIIIRLAQLAACRMIKQARHAPFHIEQHPRVVMREPQLQEPITNGGDHCNTLSTMRQMRRGSRTGLLSKIVSSNQSRTALKTEKDSLSAYSATAM